MLKRPIFDGSSITWGFVAINVLLSWGITWLRHNRGDTVTSSYVLLSTGLILVVAYLLAFVQHCWSKSRLSKKDMNSETSEKQSP